MTGALPVDRGGTPEGVRWLSLGAAIASISAVGVAIGLGVPLLSIILEQRGHSATAIGFNTAVAGLASIGVAPLAIPIAARLGVALTMLIAIALGASCFAGFYFTHDYWAWIVLRALMHVGITLLFILSEFWISASAPPQRRGLVLGIYATVLSLGFAFGPWLFARIGSEGFAPFGAGVAITVLAALPVIAAWRESPDISSHSEGGGNGRRFSHYILLVPTATAAVLVFGAVETGGFALFPVYGARLGYTEADSALLLTAIGLGNVLLQVPLGMISDRVRDRRTILAGCAFVGLAGMLALPWLTASWHATAAVLFVWGGVVAGLYTIGLAHLGSRLSGRELASANAAFVFCYGFGMIIGPQVIGAGMDVVGTHGFAWSLAFFFAAYLVLAFGRMLRRAP